MCPELWWGRRLVPVWIGTRPPSRRPSPVSSWMLASSVVLLVGRAFQRFREAPTAVFDPVSSSPSAPSESPPSPLVSFCGVVFADALFLFLWVSTGSASVGSVPLGMPQALRSQPAASTANSLRRATTRFLGGEGGRKSWVTGGVCVRFRSPTRERSLTASAQKCSSLTREDTEVLFVWRRGDSWAPSRFVHAPSARPLGPFRLGWPH